MPIYLYDHDEVADCPDFETFEKMSDNALTICPNCGLPVHRVPTIPRMIMKNAPEEPNKSARRVLKLGRDEKIFECPWTNDKGETETIRLTGSKAEQKAQAENCILRTKRARKMNLSRKDIDVNV